MIITRIYISLYLKDFLYWDPMLNEGGLVCFSSSSLEMVIFICISLLFDLSPCNLASSGSIFY